MREILSSPVFIWLAVMVLFLVIEIATVGLTSIWFAGGALAALVCALAGITPVLQAASFLAGAGFLYKAVCIKVCQSASCKDKL